MKNQIDPKELDIIIPVALELDWPTADSIVSDILEQYRENGFKRFALAAPCGGWRSVGYPPQEKFREFAELFVQVKNRLVPHGISCGWWNTLTIKSGPSDEFIRMTRADGTQTPFSNCPLDPHFRKRFAEDIALFARIAKPAFIITEDDYSVNASGFGCFCKYHLAEFAKREGRRYTREELTTLFAEETQESYALLRRWRELMRDSLVGLSEAVRREVDKESPEIPIGYMQSGACDMDGDCTEAVSRALAGENHTPFSRFYGAFYNGGRNADIPGMLYHALYTKEHIKGDFVFYHESDTFPHTRFFTSGKQMTAIMGIAYSYGFDGSTFQTQQLLDDANEEKAYGKAYAAERRRFNVLHCAAKQCRMQGVEIDYDPFWNTVEKGFGRNPLWTECISQFGIPHITHDSAVAFWDVRQAKHADNETVMRRLSKGLFLDGDAAKALCERGYGRYLGVEVGEDAAPVPLCYDLGAREVICPPFDRYSKGKDMPIAHMFANGGNGILRRLTVTDPKCEIISEACTFQKVPITPAMTRFENELGGRIVVMGMTLAGNRSQSLYNYRRQKLMQELLVWCADEYVFVRDEPSVFPVVNEAVSPEKCGCAAILTLVNLADDEPKCISLHLPPEWRAYTDYAWLDRDGEWQKLCFEQMADGIRIQKRLEYLSPLVIRVK